jgi:ribonuclease P protein subunit RPR2
MSKKLIVKKKKKKAKETAKQHMQELYDIAKKEFPKKISSNALKQLWKYSTKYKIPIPIAQKRSFCKHCFRMLVPGKSCRVRLKPGKKPLRIITCTSCGSIKRLGYTKE